MSASLANKPYRIGRSKTGLGLFATQPIKKGVKIIRYFGPLLDSRNEKHDAIENKYLFQISKRWTVDGSVRKNVARYVNHSCKPNAESDVNPVKRKIIIRSIKKIEPGEEINYDYGTEYFKEYLKPIGCKCDACEKKRAKKRAKLRAEEVEAKEKAERKAQKQAEKAKAKKEKAKAKKAHVKKALKKAPKTAPAKNASATKAKADKAKADKVKPNKVIANKAKATKAKANKAKKAKAKKV